MSKFKVIYNYFEGPTHHAPDYGDPNAPLVPYSTEKTIEATDKKDAENKIKAAHFLGVEIKSIEEVKE
jgi:hypothetical protein